MLVVIKRRHKTKSIDKRKYSYMFEIIFISGLLFVITARNDFHVE